MPKQPVLYETMYILDTRIEEAERQEAVEGIEAHVVANGGELVGSTRDFGRRRLAYEIEGHVDGIYKILYFTGFGACVDEVKHEMRLLPQVIRGNVFIANPKSIFEPQPEVKEVAPAEESAEAEAAETVVEAGAEGAVEAAVSEEAPEAAAEEAVVEESAAVAVEEAVVEEAAPEVVAEVVEEAAPAEAEAPEEPAAEAPATEA
jgi:small subunit ribosomal protein S6